MAVAQNESRIPTGTILVGKYRVLRELGRGGMAAVYEAEHLSLRKKVAVKVLAAELTASKIVSERFFREARAAASVKSPHIVDVYDSGRLEDNRPFIVMELLEGESLYDRMARDRIIDLADTAKIITDCAKGLMKAHAASIVHRDLKPENIFILRAEDGSEYCKILDFGLAKFYAPVNADEKQARLTREGAVFGTPAYMSPEQVKGQGNVDHRADLWALGCMAYECLTGRPVWNMDQGVAMTFAAIATEPLPVPSHMNPDVPPSFDAWFRKALERDPDNRFQSAKELADALEAAVSGADNTDVFPSLPEFSSAPGAVRPVEYGSERTLPGSEGVLVASTQLPSATSSSRIPLADDSGVPMSRVEPSSQPSSGVASGYRPAPSRGRVIGGGLVLVASMAGVAVLYQRMLAPQLAVPMVEAPPAPVNSEAGSGASNLMPEAPPWAQVFAEGQRALSGGDLSGALAKFKEAETRGAGSVAKAMMAHAKIAGEGRGTCRLAALSRPRFGISGNAGRPWVTPITGGTLMVWTDDHEQSGHDHAYSVVVDEAGVPITAARDITPEASQVMRPIVLAVEDKLALFYWDKSGSDAGVRARLLDKDGSIAGESVMVGGTGRNGSFWSAYTTVAGGYVAAWEDDRDGSSDLFARRLDASLDANGPEVRLTGYGSGQGRAPVVRTPAVAATGTQLLFAYRLDRGDSRSLERLRIPLLDLDKPGLPETAGNDRADRVSGEVKRLSDDKLDGPSIACGREGCFVAWHHEPQGASVAFLEPESNKRVWHKLVAPKGSRPSVASGQQGEVALSYFEGGRVKIAQLTRAGVGTASVFAKATAADVPPPSVVRGRSPGEWFVSWLDSEFGHLEPYMARLYCPR